MVLSSSGAVEGNTLVFLQSEELLLVADNAATAWKAY